MVVPTALPTEPIDLEQSIHRPRKRRNSEVAHFARENGATFESNASAATNGDHVTKQADATSQPQLNEVAEENTLDFDVDDSHSAFEDYLDQIEARPFEDDTTMDTNDIARLRARLREDGIEKFFDATVNSGMDARKLGIAFGIDPAVEVDDETYLRLLGLAVVRAFYKREKLSQYNTLEDAAALLQKSSKILVITGAGISTSLGIPDFRSKGTGFYDKIQQMGRDDIAEPQDVFDIEMFDLDPTLFYSLAGEILPDRSKGYTPTHGFIQLLDQMGKLQTNYTQNIDNLEGIAGINADKVIQCHGSFKTASCRKCKHKIDGAAIEADIRNKRVPKCKRCEKDLQAQKPQKSSKSKRPSADSDSDDDLPEPGVMKPDITFFGEQLPEDFFTRFTDIDAKDTDLVIVIGTSLKVAPVSEMPNYVPHHVPHVYISMEPIRHVEFDIQLLGKCDEVVAALCQKAGWTLKHDWVKPDEQFEITTSDGAPPFIWNVAKVDRQPTSSEQDRSLTKPAASPTEPEKMSETKTKTEHDEVLLSSKHNPVIDLT
ncbi:hypothetical protein AC579_7361 [Pseudocercospora musae]|uniref:Deacetylase sirtuin-type domain-containing protein n=1 Tax=Pseudocercospora musae TaxID=113226 RepID=A0A139ICP1_9PEZI|nr:hypothetical protein AC579_7361 [Pseudocercospora musae]